MKSVKVRPTPTKFLGVSTFFKSSVHYNPFIKKSTNINGYNHNIFNPLQGILHIQARLFAESTKYTPKSSNNNKPKHAINKPFGAKKPRRDEQFAKKKEKESLKFKKNYEIKSFEVQVVGPAGPIGIMKIGDAIKLAQQHHLDLIEVGPAARPPVCKITSFEKMEFEAKKASKSSSVKHKEMIFTTVIAEHDFETKMRKVREMLEKGHHVSITVSLPKPAMTAELLKERMEKKKRQKSKEYEEEEFRLPPDVIEVGQKMATKITLAVGTFGKPTKQPTVEHLQYKLLFDLIPGKKAQEAKEAKEAQKQNAQQPEQKGQQKSEKPGHQEQDEQKK